MDITATDNLYRELLASEDLPEIYKNPLNWYLASAQRDPYEEALDLLHLDEDSILPENVFHVLEQIFLDTASHQSSAWNDLGVLYYTGRNGVCDFQKSKECYEKGDAAGDLNCAQNLGYLYRYGQGVSPDFQKAWYYFSKAALAGHMPAMLQLARMSEFGIGCPVDFHMAYRLYERLYEEADPDDDPSLSTAVYLGMGRILYAHQEEIPTWMDYKTAWQQALLLGEDFIDEENDPTLYRELQEASSLLNHGTMEDVL